MHYLNKLQVWTFITAIITDSPFGQSMSLLIGPAICYLMALGVFISLIRTQFLTCKMGDDDNVHFIGFKGRRNVRRSICLKENKPKNQEVY